MISSPPPQKKKKGVGFSKHLGKKMEEFVGNLMALMGD